MAFATHLCLKLISAVAPGTADGVVSFFVLVPTPAPDTSSTGTAAAAPIAAVAYARVTAQSLTTIAILALLDAGSKPTPSTVLKAHLQLDKVAWEWAVDTRTAAPTAVDERRRPFERW